MELFSIYSKLIRAGYIVFRYKENVQKRTFKESEDIILKDQFGLKAPKHDTRKARVLWWPAAYEIETLPSCEVESLEGSMEESHHWTVKAKPFSSFQEIPADNDSSHADHMPLVRLLQSCVLVYPLVYPSLFFYGIILRQNLTT